MAKTWPGLFVALLALTLLGLVGHVIEDAVCQMPDSDQSCAPAAGQDAGRARHTDTCSLHCTTVAPGALFISLPVTLIIVYSALFALARRQLQGLQTPPPKSLLA